MSILEAVGYWIAPFVGGIVGALALWGIVSSAPSYTRSGVGLGADGWGPKASMVGIGAGGAESATATPTSPSAIAEGDVEQTTPHPDDTRTRYLQKR